MALLIRLDKRFWRNARCFSALRCLSTHLGMSTSRNSIVTVVFCSLLASNALAAATEITKIESENAKDCSEIEVIKEPLSTKPMQALVDSNKGQFNSGHIKPDMHGFISVAELNKLPAADKILFVDIRDAEHYASYHIPQAINIPASELASKQYLKNKPLLLIDQGFAVSKVTALFQQLTEAGFSDVKVLAGGLPAWRHANQALAGDLSAQQRVNRITPQQFYLERDYSDVLVLDLSGKELAKPKDALQKYLQQAPAKQAPSKNLGDLRIVLMTDQGQSYEVVEQALAGLAWPPVFYLEGGKQSYRAFLQSQQALWNRPTEKQGKTITCGRRKR